MAKLINGSGNPAVYANEDSDLIASLTGNVTSIAAVGSEYAATQEDANTIGLADGVIITKEGRRIQLDEGGTDLFTIPTGSAGTTSYYIIGYKLTTDTESKQVCETFVQKMNSSSETITEDTFKGGATDVYVSVYRVVQNGLNIDSINLLLPKMSNINQLNSDLTVLDNKVDGLSKGLPDYSNYIRSLDYTNTGGSYTATQDCYIVGWMQSGTADSYARLTTQFMKNGTLTTQWLAGTNNIVGSVCIPVAKGTTINIGFTASSGSTKLDVVGVKQ